MLRWALMLPGNSRPNDLAPPRLWRDAFTLLFTGKENAPALPAAGALLSRTVLTPKRRATPALPRPVPTSPRGSASQAWRRACQAPAAGPGATNRAPAPTLVIAGETRLRAPARPAERPRADTPPATAAARAHSGPAAPPRRAFPPRRSRGPRAYLELPQQPQEGQQAAAARPCRHPPPSSHRLRPLLLLPARAAALGGAGGTERSGWPGAGLPAPEPAVE